MGIPHYETAVIVGAGEGLSASLARLLARQGIRVVLAARRIDKLAALCAETGATPVTCDATDAADVARLFTEVDRTIGAPDIVIYNASARAPGVFVDLDPAAVANAINISAFGGFLVAQQALRRMLPRKHGAILFTGASASVKGFPKSSAFAMGKFALRGLAQKSRAGIFARGYSRRALRYRRRHSQRGTPGSQRSTGFNARSRRHRGELLAGTAAATQRLDLGVGAAAVG